MGYRRWAIPILGAIRSKKLEKRREQEEDFLKALYHYGASYAPEDRVEQTRRKAKLPKSALSCVIGELALAGYLELNPLRLTIKGQERVLSLIRAHRIYEKYLAEHSGYGPNEWHSKAEEMEHKLSPEEQERISSLLRNPLFDPHGDPIPRDGCDLLPSLDAEQNVELCEGAWYEVKHIEDDDERLYQQIVGAGLAQACLIKIRSLGDAQWQLQCEGESISLPIETLASLSLRRVEDASSLIEEAEKVQRLNYLREGESAYIVGISPACIGAMRRRLMDLGFVRGSNIRIDMHSPMGNPTAYIVRHTSIALRADQARHILIVRTEE